MGVMMQGLTRRTVLSGLAASLLSRPAGAQSTQTIALGMLTPLTGAAAAIGDRMARAGRGVVAWINDTARADDVRFALDVQDTRGEARDAHNAAVKVVSSGIKFVIGYGSATEKAAAAAYQDHDILDLSIANADELLPHPNLVRVIARNIDYACRVASLIEPGQKAAIIYDSSFNSGMANVVRDLLQRRGFDVSGRAFQQINIGDRDFAALISSLAALLGRGGRVVLSTGVETAGAIIRQSAEANSGLTFLGHSTLIYPDLAATAHQAVIGTDVVAIPKPDRDSVDATTVAAFERYGIPLDDLEMSVVTAALILRDALRRTKVAAPAHVRAALLAGEFDTPLGSVSFLPDGNLRDPSLSHYVWRDTPTGLKPVRDPKFPAACKM
jgi:branched-chain amino acid transport system substrate-binding protein